VFPAGLPLLPRTSAAWLLGMALVCGGLTCFSPVFAQALPTTTVALDKKAGSAPVPEQGLRWRDLRRTQQSSLQPLEGVWSSIDAEQKLKWLEIAQRMPAMPSDEQARIQLRMAEWVMLGPIERGRARFNFQEAKQQLTPEQRRAQWKAYQALSEDEKRQLVDARATAPGKGRGNGPDNKPFRKPTPGSGANNLADAGSKKSNITPNPTFAQPPTPVTPTLLRPSYGATTTLVSKPATPPAHQQVGMPKIVASSRFIDPKTLLPRRGPQAAAAFTTAASSDTPLERP
jgi:hypothetical protein